MTTIRKTKSLQEYTPSMNLAALNDTQLRMLSEAVKKEVGDRYRIKHCEGMFTFDGKPMSRTQAIEAFVANKEKKEKGIESALKKLTDEDKAYLTHMGELHLYAVRTKNESGAKRIRDLIVDKLFEYHMADKTDKIIERFYS